MGNIRTAAAENALGRAPIGGGQPAEPAGGHEPVARLFAAVTDRAKSFPQAVLVKVISSNAWLLVPVNEFPPAWNAKPLFLPWAQPRNECCGKKL